MSSDRNGSWRPTICEIVSSLDPGHLACDHDGRADGTEGDRRGVGDEAQPGGIERLEPEADEHGGGDGDRRAEPGCALEERAEAERDEQRLQPPILRDRRDRVLDDVELTGLDGEVVQEHGGDDDPADGEEAVEGAVQRRREREADGACRNRTTATRRRRNTVRRPATCPLSRRTASAQNRKAIGRTATAADSAIRPAGSKSWVHTGASVRDPAKHTPNRAPGDRRLV